MNNKQFYKDTFDQIHVPNELLGKVKEIDMKKNRVDFKKVAIAFAAALFVLVGSNAVSYAATGDTWVEKVIVLINGEEVEIDAQFEHFEDENCEGTSMTIDVDEYIDENGGSVQFEIIDEAEVK